MGVLKKLRKKLKKSVKKIGKFGKKAIKYVGPAATLSLSKSAAKKVKGVPVVGKIAAAGFLGASPLQNPKKQVKANLKALKQGAPLIGVAAGAGVLPGLAGGFADTAQGFLGSGGGSRFVEATDPGIDEAFGPTVNPTTTVLLIAAAGVVVVLFVATQKRG